MPDELPAEWSARYFAPGEMVCACCGIQRMSPGFMRRLDKLRERFGAPLVVNSGYRCPAYNHEVSTTGGQGPHTTGRAVDLAVQGPAAFQVLSLALLLGFTGIGLRQAGLPRKRFIHLDDLLLPSHLRPRVWTYAPEPGDPTVG